MHRGLVFLKAFLFVILLGFSLNAADIVEAYQKVANCGEAFEVMQKNNHMNVMLWKPVKTEQFGKIVQLRRGATDYILHNQGFQNKWTNSTSVDIGNVDFSQKPANMSFDEFLADATNTLKITFFLDQNTYEITLNTKRNMFTLTGNSFEIKDLNDGSRLFFLAKPDSPDTRNNFVLSY